MASQQLLELHRVPVEYIEIHVREDPIHPPPLTVLPEGPLAVSPGPFPFADSAPPTMDSRQNHPSGIAGRNRHWYKQ